MMETSERQLGCPQRGCDIQPRAQNCRMPEDVFDATTPLGSRWDQEGAEYVDSNAEWRERCWKRLLALNGQLGAAAALELVRDWSLKDGLRALSPELVAEDSVRPPHAGL